MRWPCPGRQGQNSSLISSTLRLWSAACLIAVEKLFTSELDITRVDIVSGVHRAAIPCIVGRSEPFRAAHVRVDREVVSEPTIRSVSDATGGGHHGLEEADARGEWIVDTDRTGDGAAATTVLAAERQGDADIAQGIAGDSRK